MKYFEVQTHQPHPPGYPLFIVLGKLLHLILPAHTSLVLLSALFALGAVLVLYIFAWHLWSKPWIAFAVTLGLTLNPLFWIYRETALTYTADAFTITLTGLLSYLALTRNPSYSLWNALALGLLSGIRPSQLLLCLPLLFLPFICKWPVRLAWRPVATLTAAAGVWLLPLIWFSGGIPGYFGSLGGLFSVSAAKTSFLFGASWASTAGQFRWLIKVLLASWNVMVLPLVGAFFLAMRELLREKRSERLGPTWPETTTRHLAVMGLAWVLPSLLVYGFIHLGQIGYLLTIVPLAYLVSGRALLAIGKIRLPSRRRAAWTFIVLLWIAHATVFLCFSTKYRDPKFNPTGSVDTLFLKLASKRDELFLMNSEVIQKNDERLEALKQIVEGYPAESTLVIAGRRPTSGPWWNASVISSDEISRTMAAILPEYRVLDINPGQPYIVKAHRFRSSYLPAAVVELLPSDRDVLFLFEDMPTQRMPRGLRIEKQNYLAQVYWAGTIDGNFDYAGLTFERINHRQD